MADASSRPGRRRPLADATTEDQEARRRAFADALLTARGSTTQVKLANCLGLRQSTISAWERGDVDLTLEQVRATETCLGLPLGTLLDKAGYIDPTELWSRPADLLRGAVFVDLAAAIDAVEAAATLDLGVRLWNEATSPDASPVWSVVLLPAAVRI